MCNFLVLLSLDELVPELLKNYSLMGLNFADWFTVRWHPVELALDRVENFSEASSRSLLLNFASLVENNWRFGFTVHLVIAQNLSRWYVLDRQIKHLRLTDLLLRKLWLHHWLVIRFNFICGCQFRFVTTTSQIWWCFKHFFCQDRQSLGSVIVIVDLGFFPKDCLNRNAILIYARFLLFEPLSRHALNSFIDNFLLNALWFFFDLSSLTFLKTELVKHGVEKSSLRLQNWLHVLLPNLHRHLLFKPFWVELNDLFHKGGLSSKSAFFLLSKQFIAFLILTGHSWWNQTSLSLACRLRKLLICCPS